MKSIIFTSTGLQSFTFWLIISRTPLRDALEPTHPSISDGTVNLREAGIADLAYRWQGKIYRQSLGPNDIITTGKRIEGRNRALVASYLVWKYGNRCFFRTPVCIMGESAFERPESADFDHFDGNKKNHRLGNLRLACNPCNSRMERERLLQWKQTARTLGEDVREKGRVSDVEITSDTVRINVDVFPIYQRWLGDNVPISVADAIHAPVLYIREKTGHGSSESNRRYLNDLTRGKDSPFVIEENKVRKR